MNRHYAFATAALLCILLLACNESPPEEARAVAGTATTDAPDPVRAETLRASAEQAMREQRLFAPAGNNALEYFLVLHRQLPGDQGVQAGLVDLQPLLVIAIEQAISRGALPEGQRLVRHLKEMDANAPALGRLQGTLADAERLAVARVQTVDADARAKAEAESVALRQQAEDNAKRLADARQAPLRLPLASPAPGSTATAAAPAAATPALQRQPAPAPAQPLPEPLAAVSTPPPTPTRAEPASNPAAGGPPRQLRVVAPVYPAMERSRGLSGKVQVAFTIGPDGSVEDSRVVNSSLPIVFSRAALSAVSRWKFEASGSRHPSQRTLVFSPAGG